MGQIKATECVHLRNSHLISAPCQQQTSRQKDDELVVEWRATANKFESFECCNVDSNKVDLNHKHESLPSTQKLLKHICSRKLTSTTLQVLSGGCGRKNSNFFAQTIFWRLEIAKLADDEQHVIFRALNSNEFFMRACQWEDFIEQLGDKPFSTFLCTFSTKVRLGFEKLVVKS